MSSEHHTSKPHASSARDISLFRHYCTIIEHIFWIQYISGL